MQEGTMTGDTIEGNSYICYYEKGNWKNSKREL